MITHDVIVLGLGGVGCATLFHLARRGRRVLGLDRFQPGHGRGSSHGHTRIIRQAYFEHPDYVPLLLRAYELWRELEALRGEKLLFQVGLLQVGSPGGEVTPGVWKSARQHGLAVERVPADELPRRFAGFACPEPCEGVFEPAAGYLLAERCVLAHAALARSHGADARGDETVVAWSARGDGVIVRTDRGEYAAARLVIAAGAWAGAFLGGLGVRPRVLRKPVYWFAAGDAPPGGARAVPEQHVAERGCPTFLYELPEGVFYGFPSVDGRGLKAARHSGGAETVDPLNVSRDLDAADLDATRAFLRDCLPAAPTTLAEHSTCLYAMSPDGHFIVDRHPEHGQVCFAAGLSGHGFKFTSLLGEVLADLALEGRSPRPIGFLGLGRPTLAGRACAGGGDVLS